MQRRTYHFSGHVQGVGFRYTAHNIVQQHNVHGYVRNLPDGRVELVMEGDEGELDDVVKTIRRKMSNFVRDCHSEVAPATGEFDHFYIRH